MLGGAAMGSDRPSVLLNAEEIARLKEEIKTLPWKRAIYEGKPVTSGGDTYKAWQDRHTLMGGGGMKANADQWLAQPIEIPARSGHFHNFFCEDGTQLLLPKNGKPDPNGYKCPSCGKVYKGEKYDACVRWQIHNELATAAFDLSLTYALEDDRKYADKAAEILKKYADAYPGPHTSHVEGGIMYQSLCEAVWVIPLAYAYDLIYDSGALSADDKAKIESKLFKQVAEGLVKVGIGGNWGSWHLSAVGVIGYSIRDQKLIDYALDSFKSQITNQLGDDGLWPESVHTYHFYPLGAFLYLAEAALHNGTDLYHLEAKPGKSLKAMFTVPLSYMYPDFRLPAINDGWFNSFLPLSQYELAYARCDDPVLGWALEEGYKARKSERQGLWALLQGRSLDDGFPVPEFRSTNFPVLGISVLRSPGGNMMTFDYGPFMGHGQPDKMGVTLFANGRLLAADYGTPGYGSSILRWYTSTPAHNTVIVDGKSQARTKERRLTQFGEDDVFEIAEAETEEAYPGVLHKRTVIRVGESFIMIDKLDSAEEHTYDWFLRSEGKLTVDMKALQKGKLGYEYVVEKAAYQADKAWSARWDSDGQGLALFMLDDGPCTITSAECPAETAARKVPLIIARKQGKQVVFTAALIPYVGESKTACSITDGLIRLEHDGMVDWIYTGMPSSLLQTDGSFALVQTKDGVPMLSSVIGGKEVVWKGHVLTREVVVFKLRESVPITAKGICPFWR